MKVLLISSSSGSHGGGEFYLILLARGLVELGCDVTVLMSSGSHMDGISLKLQTICNVDRIKLTNTYHRKTRTIGSILDRGQIKRIKSRIAQLAPDVVHINKQCIDDGLGIVIAASKAKRPTVVTVHVTRSMSSLGAAAGRIRDLVSKRVMADYPCPVIATSDQCGQDWLRLHSKSNMTIIPNGVRAVVAPTGQSKLHQLLKRERIDNQIIIGTVARIEPQKNPLFLPAVIAGLPKNVRMVWVGDGSQRTALEAEIAKQGVGDRFELLGWREDAQDLLRGLDIFVLPSLFEGFPFAILEAMSAGLPCVVSDVDGNVESVLHKKTGEVVPVNDTSAWTECLNALVRDPDLRLHYGQQALERFNSEYELSVMAKRTLACYQTAVEQYAAAKN